MEWVVRAPYQATHHPQYFKQFIDFLGFNSSVARFHFKCRATIVLIGSKRLANDLCFSLKGISGVQVTAVITPNTTDALYEAATFDNVKALDASNLVTKQEIPNRTDLIVCAHNQMYITQDAIEKANIGAIAYHPSLLPRHRGGDAVRWAIHMKDPITGGTVYWLIEKPDAGPIAKQFWCHILPTDTPKSLWDRELRPQGEDLIIETIKDVKKGKIIKQEQDESIATWEPTFSRERLSITAGK